MTDAERPAERPTAARPALWRRAFAEFLGSAFLAAIVIGSAIAAQRLSPGDSGLQLFENAAATAVGLVAIILTFGPVSGAHFNPVVSLADRAFGGLSTSDVVAHIPAQVAGCCAGAVLANRMFHLPLVELSTKTRTGGGLWLAEVVATIGLLLVIFAVVRSGRASIAPSQSAPISAAPTSGPRRQASPTPQSSSAGCCPTPSPASSRHPLPAS